MRFINEVNHRVVEITVFFPDCLCVFRYFVKRDTLVASQIVLSPRKKREVAVLDSPRYGNNILELLSQLLQTAKNGCVLLASIINECVNSHFAKKKAIWVTIPRISMLIIAHVRVSNLFTRSFIHAISFFNMLMSF